MEDLFEIFSDPIVMKNMEPPIVKKDVTFLGFYVEKNALAVVYKENDRLSDIRCFLRVQTNGSMN